MPMKGCVFNNPQLFAFSRFKTNLPTQYWEWRCHVLWPSHCESTKTQGQTTLVGAHFVATVTKFLIFSTTCESLNHCCQSWKLNPEFQPLDRVWIKTGWKFVSCSEDWGPTKGLQDPASLTFQVYLSADREIFLSQNGWADELFQGPLRLKGDAHFDPWPGWSRQNHTSLQIASK